MSPRDAAATRERLLVAADALVSRQGFAATTVDRILAEAGATKGAFFHHFPSKDALAGALLERYAAKDAAVLDGHMERAERLSDDPLEQVLLFVGLLLEVAEALDAEPAPSCLFATYCFEQGLFDEEARALVSGAFLRWRRVLGDKLRAAAERHPPRIPFEPDEVADMLTILFEGAFVFARTIEGAGAFQAQLRQYRTHLRLLFGREEAGPAA